MENTPEVGDCKYYGEIQLMAYYDICGELKKIFYFPKATLIMSFLT